MSFPKPWSVATFESERPHLTTFLKDEVIPCIDDDMCKRIIIRAPVKSGKREMVEYMAMRDNAHNQLRVHAFISAFHRRADVEQRVELEQHHMAVFSITKRDKVELCREWILKQVGEGKHVVLHLDECDYGSGAKQLFSRIWNEVRDNDSITNILYSATPEEVLYSDEVKDRGHQEMVEDMIHEGCTIRYTPPEGYCGPGKFLEEGLVYDANPFFIHDGEKFLLTEQGKGIVSDLRASMDTIPSRHIISLRLSYSQGKKKEDKAIHMFLKNLHSFPELNDFIVVVDKDSKIRDINHPGIIWEKIQWSNPTYWRRHAEAPTLLVMDQTCSRSTELACHDRLFATHDYRNKITFSTVDQALERPNHYEQKYGGFQPIRIYGHKDTLRLSAGEIDYEAYLTTKGVALSSRVSGGIKERKKYDSIFISCSQESFSERLEAERVHIRGPVTRKTFHNPFDKSANNQNGGGQREDGKWRGYLRRWDVFEYDQINREGWGGSDRVTICYRGDELGVAYRFSTGEEEVNNLHAYRSMFRSNES